MHIILKRAYQAPEPTDRLRIPVGRLWPTGASNDSEHIELRLKDIAPAPLPESDSVTTRQGGSGSEIAAFRNSAAATTTLSSSSRRMYAAPGYICLRRKEQGA